MNLKKQERNIYYIKMNNIYKAGISAYIGLEDYKIIDNLKYLELAKKLGYECVFSSFHIMEAKNTFEELNLLIDKCNELSLELSLDVSKEAYLKLNDETKVHSLRLDYGFSIDEIVELSKRRKIELNASTMTMIRINQLLSLGLNKNNVRLSFNFYPKKYTGHDLEDVKNKTLEFKKAGFEVACFIPSHHSFRPPLYEGLPTIEKHRSCDLDVAVEELKAIGVDYIYFGDAIIKEDELKQLINHQCEEILVKLIKMQKNNVFEPNLTKLYNIRPDYNSLMLRISKDKNQQDIPCFNNVERNIGALTIDNHLFKRYMGEINIITSNLEKDERVNVIGYVQISPLMIESIKKKLKIRFII